ncbi:MAG: isoprenylcysteine carboxylmethyltransferase family protein [Acidobacteriota bacterium]|nr:MAG: isoprenylcysteine carboxylmethyltransferase family protein [Acidobacteriota bacterium]
MNKRILQRIRVPLGFAFAAVFLYFAKPTAMTLVIGSAVAVVGLAIRAWASGHIRKAKVLAVSGPYAFTRNPLYVGSLLMGVGFTVAAGVWWLTLLFAVLFIGIYLPVMRVEAEDMLRIFGAEYEEYADNVPMLIPRPSPWKSSDVGFDFQLYLQYREYRAALGVAGAIAILAVKAVVWPQ